MPPIDPTDDGGGGPPDDDLLAGELVLGVLSAAERDAARARATSDPGFAARVMGWERRLAPWLSRLAPEPVPADLWARLCRQLGWQGPQPAVGWWSSLTLWRSVAVLAMVAAIALWLTRAPVSPPPSGVPLPERAPQIAGRPVTELRRDNGTPGWLASVDRTRGTLLMVPVPVQPDAQGRVPELWIIAAGQAPRSLGAVSISNAHLVEVPPDVRTALGAPGSVLAVTLEPPAGLPHAAPTGPIVAKGSITL